MNEEIQRYPLSWPAGWKRTLPAQRGRARLRRMETKSYTSMGGTYKQSRELSVWDATRRLLAEMDLLGAERAVASTNLQVRMDGLPRSGQRTPDDTGVAVYFNLGGKPRCLACDRWDRVADNLAGIAAHINAIRAVDRYGVGTLDQAFAGYKQLQASPEDWWIVLGVERTANLLNIESTYRRLAKKHHPDRGGDPGEMVRLNQARKNALQELQ